MCVCVCVCVYETERQREREREETLRTMNITDRSVVASLIHLTSLIKDYLVGNWKPL